MVPMSDTCILIPTYNNAGTIAGVVRRALDQGLSVIVVDDGSTDGTSVALAGLDATVLRQDPNRGKGIALRTGLRAARERGFRYAVTLDADGQHYPEDVPALLAAGGPPTACRPAIPSPISFPISGSPSRPCTVCRIRKQASASTRWNPFRRSG